MKKFIIIAFLVSEMIINSGCFFDKKSNLDVESNQLVATGIFSQTKTIQQENNQINSENNTNFDDSTSQGVDYVNFFLVNDPEEINYDDFDKYFVSIKGKLENPIFSTEDKILYSLNKLFEVKTYKYNQTDYVNYLYESNLIVNSITNEDGKYVIDIKGQIVGIGSVADMFIKTQITKTIDKYTQNYVVKLNNSESQWRCALDNTGECE